MVSFSKTRRAWTKRSLLEKSLLKSVVVLTLLVIGLIIAVVLVPRYRNKDENLSICRTKSCLELGTHLQQSMDRTKDPCEDFYTYTCGGWLQEHEIPPGKRQYGTIEKLSEDVLYKLNGLLSEGGASTNSTAVQNALKYYWSCMNTSAIESRGSLPLHKLLSAIGGWPVVNDTWTEDSFDWLSAVSEIQLRTSYGFIFLLLVGPDAKNTSSNVLQLDRPTISLLSSTLLDPHSNSSKIEIDGYKKFFKKVALLLGAKKDRLDEDFEGIMQFETDLVRMMRPDEEMRNPNVWYNKMTVEDLSTNVSEIKWLQFLQMVTNSTLLEIGDAAVVKNTDPIIVRDMEYIQNVSKYMKTLENYRQVANYLGWRVIMTRMLHLPSQFGEAVQNYSRDTGLPSRAPERWMVCTSQVKSSFLHVSSFLFVNRYFRKLAMHQVGLLASQMRNIFEDTFDESIWMDHRTKKAAKNKLKAMKLNIGYPEWVIDAEELDRYYSEANTPQMTDYAFEDELALIQHATMQAITTLRNPSQRQEWSISPVTINAAYSLNRNEITVPAAFLQFPMYDPTLPRYYNYAAIGTVVAHEMTHGFDSEGKLRNATGNIQNWWSAEAEDFFNRKAQCFIDQYQGYNVNGKQTLAENIADNVGLRQAYKAFHNWENSTKTILRLPRLERYTPEQLFFISYASVWCTKYQSEFLEYISRHDAHSPAQFRVEGTISNMKEFAAAFGCKSNASHNREQRCIIWR